MSDIFLRIANMSIASSWLIMVVLILRLVCGKAPRWTIVLLWGLVGIRLVVPITFTSELSLVPSTQTIQKSDNKGQAFHINSGWSVVDERFNASLGKDTSKIADQKSKPSLKNRHDVHSYSEVSLMDAISFIWLVVVGGLLIYAIAVYIRIRKNCLVSIPYEENIFISDGVSSPFILGIVSPKIYLPTGLDKDYTECILAHERAHLERKDHIWKLISYMILCVHWFNPLVWVAYMLFCRDIEVACDEKVISGMDLDGKKVYAKALVDLSIQKRIVIGCPLAFGEIGVKERVRKVMNYKKTGIFAVVSILIVCVIVGFTFLTSPSSTSGKNSDKNSVSDVKSERLSDSSDESIEIKQPQISLNDPLGADPTVLLYADSDTLVFSGYYGLFVYSKTERKIVSALDLEYIGCNATQGDDVCEKVISEDGSIVYLHSMSSEDMYLYDTKKEQLIKKGYDDNLFSKLRGLMDEKREVDEVIDENMDGEPLYMENTFIWSDGKTRIATYLFEKDKIGELYYVDENMDTSESEIADNNYPIFNPDGFTGAKDFIPKDMHDIVSADLWIGREPGLSERYNLSDAGLVHIEDKKILSDMSQLFAESKSIKGWSACPFDTALYFTRSDGTIGVVFPATDSCDAFVSGNICYEMPKGANEKLWGAIKESGISQKKLNKILKNIKVSSEFTDEEVEDILNGHNSDCLDSELVLIEFIENNNLSDYVNYNDSGLVYNIDDISNMSKKAYVELKGLQTNLVITLAGENIGDGVVAWKVESCEVIS